MSDAEPPHTPPVSGSVAERGSRAVAFLLAVAAVVAAVVTARAAILGSDATSAWNDSVAQEQRRGAYLLEGVRFTYGSEGDLAFMIAGGQVTVQELSARASGRPPELAARLAAEASVQQGVLDAVLSSSEVAGDPRYARPDGGFDLQLRLADERRAEEGNITAIDPLGDVAAGDAAADHAGRLLQVTIVIGAAFLAGSLAQSVARRRRELLALGWVTLAVACALAVVVELDVAGAIAATPLR